VTDAEGRSTNDDVVRARLGTGHRLLHQVRWESGIAVVADRQERSLTALLRAKVRWVNREEGSAARQTFDTLLASHRRPAGYDRVVRDHRAVATTVASGWVEVGVCVRSVAAEARLSFIPVH
jgi:molybdate-binding protein